jgi:hypothetical protein
MHAALRSFTNEQIHGWRLQDGAQIACRNHPSFATRNLEETRIYLNVTYENGLLERYSPGKNLKLTAVSANLSIRLDAVFETVQLPAGIANLDTGLADVDGDYFTHFCLCCGREERENSKRKRGCQKNRNEDRCS